MSYRDMGKNFRLSIVCLLFTLMKMPSGQSQTASIWVDSIFNTLTLDEKIGQLFMVRAYSKSDNADVEAVKAEILKNKVGGICFFQGSPKRQAELTNIYQSIAKTPLLISIDGEWGLGMRFPEGAISFPRQLTLGAIQDNSLIEEFGFEVATELKRLGIHVNFAPVVDVNNNSKNPVINDRSFGEDKFNVSAKALAYMNGMQQNGILACAKHFPGHGDTETDSHFDLPTIHHDRARLENIEFFPFRTLSNSGLASMMVAHLNLPAIDDRSNRPTTLSKFAITDILRQDFGFQGLIFTDALEMKALTKHFPAGIAEAEAFMAGNDVLLLSENVDAAINKIKQYLNEGKITIEMVNASVKRILLAKHKAGLNNRTFINTEKVIEEVNSNRAYALKSKLIEKSITLVTDNKDLVPVSVIQGERIASLSIGDTKRTAFQERLSSYASFDHYNTTSDVSAGVKASIIGNLKAYDKVIIGLHGLNRSYNKSFGVSQTAISLIKEIAKTKEVVLCVFGNPYALKFFEEIGTVVMSYEDDDLFRDITAQSIFGAIGVEGKLPVTASEQFYANIGITRPPIQKFGYALPERVGLNSVALEEIDEIASDLMADKSSPGCQILIAKDGKIVWEKSYGHFTYNFQEPVDNETVYDLASMTKILATTISIMKLQELGKLNINSPINNYLAEADTCNKSGMVLKDMMAHVAGLLPWIPFYTETLTPYKKQMVPSPNYYSTTRRDSFTVPVAKKMFLRQDYRDTVWSKIFGSNLREGRDYRYSDLGMYIASRIIENTSGQRQDKFANDQFYSPMGLPYMTYNPLSKIPMDQIAPSELDNYWRYQEIRGNVHDMGAAMMGGVSGHAGLFSNARDVAAVMQMLLNGGSYGGKRYLKPSTILRFTTRHPRSTRRAIGFDMKEMDPGKSMNMSEFASEWTYGHTGFTGTATYADPVHNIVFVFLSNRTYPNMNNNRLNNKDYRPKIQSCIYKALMNEV
ncbi:MAG: serine hydrolase [Saprospiraceae bacterium]|nr:serine hydrolase [Saprospiraceae bacterium]